VRIRELIPCVDRMRRQCQRMSEAHARALTRVQSIQFSAYTNATFADTSRIVGEAALSLAFDDCADADGQYPCLRSGVLTPASAFGLGLMDRLEAHGMRLTHERLASDELPAAAQR